MRSIRPTGINILLGFLILLLAWDILRAANALFFWPVLQAYTKNSGVVYVFLSGLLPAMASGGLVWATWRRKRWAWSGNLGFLLVYFSWSFLDLLVIGQKRDNTILEIILALIILVILGALLYSSKVRNYFNE